MKCKQKGETSDFGCFIYRYVVLKAALNCFSAGHVHSKQETEQERKGELQREINFCLSRQCNLFSSCPVNIVK